MKASRLKAAASAIFIASLVLPHQKAEAQSSFAGGLAGGIVGGMIAGSIAANAYRQQHGYYGRPRYVRRNHAQVAHTRNSAPADNSGKATIKASADPFATGKPQAADSPIPVSAKP